MKAQAKYIVDSCLSQAVIVTEQELTGNPHYRADEYERTGRALRQELVESLDWIAIQSLVMSEVSRLQAVGSRYFLRADLDRWQGLLEAWRPGTRPPGLHPKEKP